MDSFESLQDIKSFRSDKTSHVVLETWAAVKDRSEYTNFHTV